LNLGNNEAFMESFLVNRLKMSVDKVIEQLYTYPVLQALASIYMLMLVFQ